MGVNMPLSLTPKQQMIVDAIQDISLKTGNSPSYRELLSAVGMRNVSALYAHIERLKKKGYIITTPFESRSFVIVVPND